MSGAGRRPRPSWTSSWEPDRCSRGEAQIHPGGRPPGSGGRPPGHRSGRRLRRRCARTRGRRPAGPPPGHRHSGPNATLTIPKGYREPMVNAQPSWLSQRSQKVTSAGRRTAGRKPSPIGYATGSRAACVTRSGIPSRSCTSPSPAQVGGGEGGAQAAAAERQLKAPDSRIDRAVQKHRPGRRPRLLQASPGRRGSPAPEPRRGAGSGSGPPSIMRC